MSSKRRTQCLNLQASDLNSKHPGKATAYPGRMRSLRIITTLRSYWRLKDPGSSEERSAITMSDDEAKSVHNVPAITVHEVESIDRPDPWS